MKVNYYPDTDSLFVKLKPGPEAEGSKVAPGILFHYTSEGEVTAIDIDSRSSKLDDLSLLEVEGLLVGVSPTSGREQSPLNIRRRIRADPDQRRLPHAHGVYPGDKRGG